MCINDHNQLLVAYQYNHPPRRIVDELPGGRSEPTDSSIEETARRELLEEIGFYAHHMVTIGSFLPNTRRSAGRCYVCLATNLEQRTAAPEETEHIAYQWVDVAAIDRLIRAGELVNGFLLAAWSIYQAYQRHPDAT